MKKYKHCIGCGVTLQDENMTAEGYTSSLENDICSRCFKMKNYGMPQLNPRSVSQKNGDLLVQVSIEVPKKLTKEQRVKLEAFSEALGENSDSKKNVKKNL